MADTALTEELKEQFRRQFDTLTNFCDIVPDDQWRSGTIDYLIPARQIYHLVFSLDAYMNHMSFEDYRAHRRFKIDWEACPPSDLPTQVETMQHLCDMRAKVIKWLDDLGDAGLMSEDDQCPWVGKLKVSRALYNLRHIQAHIGELNSELRRRNLSRAKANGPW